MQQQSVPGTSVRSLTSDLEDLLNYARRYFQAAAQSADHRKMQLLVNLGLEYLRLAAKMERARLRHLRKNTRKERPLHKGETAGRAVG